MVVTGPTDNGHSTVNVSKGTNWHLGQRMMTRTHSESGNSEEEDIGMQ